MTTKKETEVCLPVINWKILRFKRNEYLSELIDSYGTDILYKADESGLFPIHWAVIFGLQSLFLNFHY